VSVWHLGRPADGHTVRVSDYLNLPTAVSPPADRWIYPAPQWGNTVGASGPINRNGELWRDMTVSASNALLKEAGSWDRYYVEFTKPTMMIDTGKAVHAWVTSLAESATKTVDGTTSTKFRGMPSIRSKISSSYGHAYGAAGAFEDFNSPYGPMFKPQGVAAGDRLWINSRKYNCLNTSINVTGVSAVSPGNTVFTASGAWGTVCGGRLAGQYNIRYKIIRNTAPRGECLIDEYFGGGPDGYGCKANTFWTAMGPMVGAGTTVRVHIPAAATGYRTLMYGATGYVPDLWDGISGNANTQLDWSYGAIVYNTGSYNQGGLGGKFDFQNQDWRIVDTAQQWHSSDNAFVLRQ
jgi:hypothetical protein